MCGTVRTPDESETMRGLTLAAEVSTICQDAGLPIKMVRNPFEPRCLWFILQVETQQLRAFNTNMEDFSLKVAHAVLSSNLRLYIPKMCLVRESMDPTNHKDAI